MKDKRRETPEVPPVQDRPSAAAIEFMLQEYRSQFDYHQANKDVGDTRMASFITITGVVFTALIAVQDFVLPIAGPFLLVFGCFVLVVLGLTTFRKMLQRRAAIVISRRRMAHIRIWFLKWYPELADGMVYGINENMPIDWGKNKIGTTARTIVLVNCSLVMLTFLWFSVQIWQAQSLFVSIPLGILVSAGFWYIHVIWKRKFFADSERMDEYDKLQMEAVKIKYSTEPISFTPDPHPSKRDL